MAVETGAPWSRHIRENLGQQLRAYYRWAQQAPLPDRLAELVERLVLQLESKAANPAGATE
jgi:hypothetical protein